LHPVKDTPLHVDFYVLSKESQVIVEVPVLFLNEDACPGLKKGGVLNIVRHNVEVSCPADAIPENLEVDLSEADTGDSIHISAVALPKDVTPTITDRDFTIATIAAPAGMTEESDEETSADETATESTDTNNEE
jgi:large subunit ribosomal protein L25